MGDRKTGIHVTIDNDVYRQYRNSLRGTRFDNDGQINASAALRYHMECVVDANQQRRREEVIPQLPTTETTSDILQSKNDYLVKEVNKISAACDNFKRESSEVERETAFNSIPFEEKSKIHNKAINFAHELEEHIRKVFKAQQGDTVEDEVVKKTMLSDEEKAELSSLRLRSYGKGTGEPLKDEEVERMNELAAVLRQRRR
jgi:hypothetical protein